VFGVGWGPAASPTEGGSKVVAALVVDVWITSRLENTSGELFVMVGLVQVFLELLTLYSNRNKVYNVT
jgi:hypothetical protein